jgi:peptidoglycan/LPS O-acetylase OafA/YrhL
MVRRHNLLAACRLGDVDHGRANNLNLIRFLLASAVILSHSYGLLRENDLDPLHRLLHWGLLGETAVFGFFFVSGYLILKSGLRSAGPKEFLAARFLRIFPGLAGTVVLCALVVGPLNSSLPAGRYFASPATYSFLRAAFLHGTQNPLPGVFENLPAPGVVNGSLWTLPMEWALYMAVLVGCLAVSRRKDLRSLDRMTWFFFALSVLLTIQMFPIQWNFVCVGCFALGAACYLARSKVILSVPFAVIAFGFVASSIGVYGSYLGKRLYPLALCYLIATFGFHRGTIFRVFHRIGDYSYGLYIFAWPIQQMLVARVGGPLRLFVVSYPLTLAAAILSWHFIEEPCLALRERLRGEGADCTSNRVESRSQTFAGI